MADAATSGAAVVALDTVVEEAQAGSDASPRKRRRARQAAASSPLRLALAIAVVSIAAMVLLAATRTVVSPLSDGWAGESSRGRASANRVLQREYEPENEEEAEQEAEAEAILREQIAVGERPNPLLGTKQVHRRTELARIKAQRAEEAAKEAALIAEIAEAPIGAPVPPAVKRAQKEAEAAKAKAKQPIKGPGMGAAGAAERQRERAASAQEKGAKNKNLRGGGGAQGKGMDKGKGKGQAGRPGGAGRGKKGFGAPVAAPAEQVGLVPKGKGARAAGAAQGQGQGKGQGKGAGPRAQRRARLDQAEKDAAARVEAGGAGARGAGQKKNQKGGGPRRRVDGKPVQQELVSFEDEIKAIKAEIKTDNMDPSSLSKVAMGIWRQRISARMRSGEVAQAERLWTTKGSQLEVSEVPVEISPEVRAELIAPPDVSPQEDGRAMVAVLFGAAKAGTTSLHSTLVDDSYHLLPFTNPGLAGSRRRPIKEFCSGVINRDLQSYWADLQPLDNPNDAVPQATEEGIRTHCTQCLVKDPRLPAVLLDGSPFVYIPAYVRGLHDSFVDILDRMRWVMTIKDPVARVESAYWHMVSGIPESQIDDGVDISLKLDDFADRYERAVQECVKPDAPLGPENTYVCAYSQTQSIDAQERKKLRKGDPFSSLNTNWLISASMYAENLRYAYCVLVLHPHGVPCPAWDDPAIDGLLEYGVAQNRLMVTLGDDIKRDSVSEVAKIMAHIGVPNDRKPYHEKVETGKRGQGGQIPEHSHNENKHRQELSPAVAARLARLFLTDDDRLWRMLGRAGNPGWDLRGMYLQK